MWRNAPTWALFAGMLRGRNIHHDLSPKEQQSAKCWVLVKSGKKQIRRGESHTTLGTENTLFPACATLPLRHRGQNSEEQAKEIDLDGMNPELDTGGQNSQGTLYHHWSHREKSLC